ncbi:phage holin, LLH family [Fusobacterium hominis]|uniref:Uncharacterized protein n=1 Tax=Fusobacterium hominis TaxID=2764326 RepID=A0A7G9GXK1_9FUSO|nr:phage holin, LLH family [Fusobacterium hominis]QNM15533.1 hypothetical protein H9Q81_01445 [Fusobacterium hominis]
MTNKVQVIGWVVFAVVILSVLGCIFLFFKYKKEGKLAKEEKIKRILLDLSYYAVCQAELYYKDGHGKEKLEYSIKKVKSQLPAFLAFFISEEMIVGTIEYALSELQLIFKSQKENRNNILNKIIEVGTKTQDVKETLKVAENLKENNGYIEGFGEIRTNFHGETEGAAGVRAGIKL